MPLSIAVQVLEGEEALAEQEAEGTHLLPTPRASDMNGYEPLERAEHRDKLETRIRRVQGEEAKLLPTPVVTDAFGSRRSTARTEDWVSHPGTSLTDALWETQGRETDTTGRMLPTPTARLGRPGGGAAQAKRYVNPERSNDLDDAIKWLGEQTDAGSETELLPTPTTQDAHNNGGQSQQERNTPPLNAVAPTLLPTPAAADADGGRIDSQETVLSGRRPSGAKASVSLREAITYKREPEPQLLPTPRHHSQRSSRRAMVEVKQWAAPSLEQALEIAEGILPREFESWEEVPGWSQSQSPSTGASTDPQSESGSTFSDEQLPGQLTIGDDSSLASSSGCSDSPTGSPRSGQ
jgi:hypothetical protein